MSLLFYNSQFNGEISKWDVSNINSMEGMFSKSQFNQDLSQWNVSNVKDMNNMFSVSKFNRDISRWDVSSVKNMSGIFIESQFNGDISDWKPLSIIKKIDMFRFSTLEQNNNLPYWANIEPEFIKSAINAYELNQKLNQDLTKKDNNKKTSIKV